jgi:hypothetical protein
MQGIDDGFHSAVAIHDQGLVIVDIVQPVVDPDLFRLELLIGLRDIPPPAGKDEGSTDATPCRQLDAPSAAFQVEDDPAGQGETSPRNTP